MAQSYIPHFRPYQIELLRQSKNDYFSTSCYKEGALAEVIATFLEMEKHSQTQAFYNTHRCCLSLQLLQDPITLTTNSAGQAAESISLQNLLHLVHANDTPKNPLTKEPFSESFLESLKNNPKTLINQKLVDSINHELTKTAMRYSEERAQETSLEHTQPYSTILNHPQQFNLSNSIVNNAAGK